MRPLLAALEYVGMVEQSIEERSGRAGADMRTLDRALWQWSKERE